MIDTHIVAKASDLSGLTENKFMRAFGVKTSIFNQFTHEKERTVAYLKLALAELLADNDLLLHGFSGQLIPREVSHVLSLCLIADMKSRVALATKEKGIDESEAIKQIRRDDEEGIAWVETLFRKKDPWDPSLYDILIPTDKMSREEIIGAREKEPCQGHPEAYPKFSKGSPGIPSRRPRSRWPSVMKATMCLWRPMTDWLPSPSTSMYSCWVG